MMIWTLSAVALPGICKADSLEQTGEWGRGEPGLDRSLEGEQLWVVACCWGRGETTLVGDKKILDGFHAELLPQALTEGECERRVQGQYGVSIQHSSSRYGISNIQRSSQEIESWSHLIYSSSHLRLSTRRRRELSSCLKSRCSSLRQWWVVHLFVFCKRHLSKKLELQSEKSGTSRL